MLKRATGAIALVAPAVPAALVTGFVIWLIAKINFIYFTYPQVHWTIPVFVTLISIYFVISPLILNPSFVYFVAIGFYIICGIGYYIFLYKKVRFPGFDRMTLFLQKLLCVAETEWDGFDFEKSEEDKK